MYPLHQSNVRFGLCMQHTQNMWPECEETMWPRQNCSSIFDRVPRALHRHTNKHQVDGHEYVPKVQMKTLLWEVSDLPGFTVKEIKWMKTSKRISPNNFGNKIPEVTIVWRCIVRCTRWAVEKKATNECFFYSDYTACRYRANNMKKKNETKGGREKKTLQTPHVSCDYFFQISATFILDIVERILVSLRSKKNWFCLSAKSLKRGKE